MQSEVPQAVHRIQSTKSQSNKQYFVKISVPKHQPWHRHPLEIQQNIREDPLLSPCVLEVGHFVFNKVLSPKDKKLFSSPLCSDALQSESSEISPCCILSLLL